MSDRLKEGLVALKPEFYSLFKIAIPISVSQLGHIMVGFVDSVLAGNIGRNELAAATVSNSIFFPLLTFVLGITSGITPLAAFQFGKNDLMAMKKLHLHSFFINAFMCVAMYFLMYGLGTFIINLYGSQNIQGLTLSFFRIFLLSIFPIVFFQTFKQYAEAIGYTKLASVVTISCNVLNVVLSVIMVKTYGLDGIAWATLIARVCMALVFVLIFYTDRHLATYRIYLGDFKAAFSWEIIRKLASTSVPFGLQMLVESAAFGAAGLMAIKIGIIEGDAHQIALQIASVVYMISTGLGAASTVRIGHVGGRGDVAAIRKVVLLTIVLMMLYNIVTAASILVFKEGLSVIFTQDAQIVALSVHLLLFAASFQFFDGLQVACLGILRGFHDITVPMILVALAYWAVALPMGYMMAFHWGFGVDGIWYALLLGLFLVSMILFVRIRLKMRAMQHS
jgi:multidrug resistance protein, MATE family